MSDLPYVDPAGVAVWIAERIDVDADIVATVLDVEFEYQLETGITVGEKRPLRYYTPGELAGAPAWVDTTRIAQDVERHTGISEETAMRVFDAELDYFRMRGLA